MKSYVNLNTYLQNTPKIFQWHYESYKHTNATGKFVLFYIIKLNEKLLSCFIGLCHPSFKNCIS